MRLIDPNIVTFEGRVSDEDLKARLLQEAMEQAGCIGEDGQPLKGVKSHISRDGGRSGQRSWIVRITRDLRLSDQARIEGPKD